MNFQVPILFQFYNNYDTTIRVLQEIRKVQPLYLYLVQDKYRDSHPEEELQCKRVNAAVLEMIDWDCKLFTLFREENLGPGAGTADGIAWFFSQVEYGIILEHDCLPHPHFFEFCAVLLEKYKDDKRVKAISGANFRGNLKFVEESYYFGTIGHLWGWAAWKRSFSNYEQDIANYTQEEVYRLVDKNFKLKRQREYWYQTYHWLKDRKVDTWDYQMFYSAWKEGSYVILPNGNLISNIGFGENALNCREVDSPLANAPVFDILPLIHPRSVKSCTKANVFYSDFLYNLKDKPSFLYTIKRKVKNRTRKMGYRIIRFFVPEIPSIKKSFAEHKQDYEDASMDQMRREMGFCGENVLLHYPIINTRPQNVFLYENTRIYENSMLIILSAKFIIKKNSVAAQGLTVVTGNHTSKPGVWLKDLINVEDEEKDVIVEEDVWIATNVTLLAGIKVGRGAIIGASTVVRKSVPPYSIVVGNPAKIVGFKFTPMQVIEHELALYPAEERLSLDLLERNYKKYAINSLDGIQDYLKLSCSEQKR
jgi:acetyltransferase-like isoleucine patch superfamily enzyme